MRTRRVLIAACAAGLILAGCSSGSGSTTSSGSTVPASAATTAPTTSAPAGSTGGAGASSSTTLFASGPVPAVSGATDMSKEPTIAAGGSNPPTALTGKDLVVGTGQVAGPNDTVQVQYVGALYQNGKVFDASWTDNGPATFPLSGVVPGFKDAIIGMHIGGRREIVIPPALGYGAAGSPPVIPPNSTLVFVIDLLAISGS